MVEANNRGRVGTFVKVSTIKINLSQNWFSMESATKTGPVVSKVYFHCLDPGPVPLDTH